MEPHVIAYVATHHPMSSCKVLNHTRLEMPYPTGRTISLAFVFVSNLAVFAGACGGNIAAEAADGGNANADAPNGLPDGIVVDEPHECAPMGVNTWAPAWKP